MRAKTKRINLHLNWQKAVKKHQTSATSRRKKSDTYWSVNFIWMWKNKTMNTGNSGDKDDNFALVFMNTRASQEGSVLKSVPYMGANKIIIQRLLHQLQNIPCGSPEWGEKEKKSSLLSLYITSDEKQK